MTEIYLHIVARMAGELFWLPRATLALSLSASYLYDIRVRLDIIHNARINIVVKY